MPVFPAAAAAPEVVAPAAVAAGEAGGGALGAGSLGPVGLAGLGGVAIGLGFNAAWNAVAGQPFGGSVYDWTHPSASSDFPPTLPAPTPAERAQRAANAAIEKAKDSSCPPSDDSPDRCEKQYELDWALCTARASTVYGYQGQKVCRTSATKRYAECRKGGGPGAIQTPLAGVDTPL